ncbi:MAG: rhodanese-like domain-containing protein [Thalassotalea sp.]
MLLPITTLAKQAKENISTLSAADAVTFAKSTDCLIIDVREAAEVEKSAVKHSLAIPRGVLEAQIITKCNDENMPILVHCQSGGRACLAVEQLIKMGYKNVQAITASHQEICQLFND